MTYATPFLRPPAGDPHGEGAGTDLAAARPDAGDARGLGRNTQGPWVAGESATPRPAVSCSAVRVVSRIPAAEFFDPPCGRGQLLPARPPRMTRGADGDAELRDGRAGGIGRATRTHNRGFAIGGMLRGLHERLLSHWYEVGCPGWPVTVLRADALMASEVQAPEACDALALSGSSGISMPPAEHSRTVCSAAVPVRPPRAGLAAPCAPTRCGRVRLRSQSRGSGSHHRG